MTTDNIQTTQLRVARALDLKMMDASGKLVLRINTLVWVKCDEKVFNKFWGPILINNHTSRETMNKLAELLNEERIYIVDEPFTFIPQKT